VHSPIGIQSRLPRLPKPLRLSYRAFSIRCLRHLISTGSISGRDHPHLSRFVSKVVPHTHAVKSRQHSSEVMQPPSPYVPDLNTSTYDRMEAFQRICENSLATHQPPRCSRCSPLPDHATTSLERPRQIRLTAFSSLSPFWP
jgi:hypothetical protein